MNVYLCTSLTHQTTSPVVLLSFRILLYRATDFGFIVCNAAMAQGSANSDVVKALSLQRMKKFAVLFSLLAGVSGLQAQVSVKDSTVRCAVLMASYSGQLPGGNLASRFGFNSNVGFGCLYKTKTNLLWGLEWNYMFGTDVKEDTILNSIATTDGFVIDQEGTLAEIRIAERGFSLMGHVGKILPLGFSSNKNCGLMLVGGLGYLQHKIRIDDVGNRAPQLRGDYKKGYDRLTGGLAISQFIGYWHMGNSRLVNFYGGIELTEAATVSLRSWDYSSMSRDTARRTDILYGIRVGWMLPLYKRTPKEYYSF